MSVSRGWDGPPRGLRALAEISDALHAQRDGNLARVILLAGAGVDTALSGRPEWTKLIAEIATPGMPAGPAGLLPALAPLAKQWPSEAAQAVRFAVGSRAFDESIANQMTSAPNLEAEMAVALRKLVAAGLRVIVTLNYSDDVVSVVRRLVPQKTVHVIERVHLRAWRPIDLLNPPDGSVHVIKLHGSAAAGVVLDRSSYDEVVLEDYHYTEILNRVFEDYIVLSIGFSWQDVPLRNAAAFAQRRFPLAARTHFAVLSAEGDRRVDWWKERAFMSSFGVRPLFYRLNGRSQTRHSEASEILRHVSEPANLGSLTARSHLAAIANGLDDIGDYEAAEQGRWFTIHWETLANRILRTRSASASNWLALARIERHLRHFLWFHLPDRRTWEAAHRGSPSTNTALTDLPRELVRERLWRRVATLWNQLAEFDRGAAWNPVLIRRAVRGERAFNRGTNGARGAFEFALGYYEVAPVAPAERDAWNIEFGEWDSRLAATCRYSPVLRARLALARHLWVGNAKHGPELRELREMAIDARWDSIEAKIVLDGCQSEFAEAARHLFNSLPEVSGIDSSEGETDNHNAAGDYIPAARTWNEGTRSRLRMSAIDAWQIAHISGNQRREFGSIALASLVMPPLEAEGLLLHTIRGMQSQSPRAEPTSMWSIYIALLAVYCDHYSPSSLRDEKQAWEWLTERCGPLVVPDPPSVVADNFARHWRQYHQQAADLASSITRLIRRR